MEVEKLFKVYHQNDTIKDDHIGCMQLIAKDEKSAEEEYYRNIESITGLPREKIRRRVVKVERDFKRFAVKHEDCLIRDQKLPSEGGNIDLNLGIVYSSLSHEEIIKCFEERGFKKELKEFEYQFRKFIEKVYYNKDIEENINFEDCIRQVFKREPTPDDYDSVAMVFFELGQKSKVRKENN